MRSNILLWIISGAACCGAQTCTAPSVGFRVLNFGGRNVAVWYPSTSSEAAYAYSDQLSGSVARDGAPAACHNLPLLVFSHGYTGCGTQSAFITEALGRKGYIVAAPDHADHGCSVTQTGGRWPPPPEARFMDPAAWNDQSYADRRQDIEATLDGMLASSVFGPMVDASRIAGMGHSLGGYTILAMIGGWPSWLEPRLKAAVLLSPYCQPFLDRKTLPKVRVPIEYQGGTLDIGITPFVGSVSGAYDQAAPPKFFVELRAAGHLAWSDFVCGSASTISACLANPKAALINQYGFAFLDHYLRGTPAPLLSGRGLGLADYRHNAPGL
jgi:predicted dienelactone hydrolase